MNVTANHVVSEDNAHRETRAPIQLNLFANGEAQRRQEAERRTTLSRERRMQQTLLNIKKKFGKNAILKGIDFEEGATTRERNIQIGGHRA